jgi:hypothetical protein
MKKFLKIGLLILFVGIVGLQFIRPERTNPPIIEGESLESSTSVPKEINDILERSCNDCHSNKTNFPWYSNIAPISWSVVDHIRVGREELNFSKWNTYAKERKLRKLEEICEEIEGRHMPHNQYLWIHWDAKLSDLQIQKICEWTKTTAKEIEQ